MTQVTVKSMTAEIRDRLEQAFGAPAVDSDDKTAIFNATGVRVIASPVFAQISRQSQQLVELNLHPPGATAQVGDRVYVFGADGKWHRQYRL